MTEQRRLDLGSLVADDLFPDVDLALRRGRHIDRDDGPWYTYLRDGEALLAEFYERFSCSLVHASDGYFYLLPASDRLGRRHLAVPEMLVGQGLALLYLDPSTVRSGGVVERDAALGHLATVMGSDALVAAFNPKKKRMDERVAQQMVRQRFAEAARKLAGLGFVELLDDGKFRLRASLMRFAEPVRGTDSPSEALAALVARGEVLLRKVGESENEGASKEGGANAARESRKSASTRSPGPVMSTALVRVQNENTDASEPGAVDDELSVRGDPSWVDGSEGEDASDEPGESGYFDDFAEQDEPDEDDEAAFQDEYDASSDPNEYEGATAQDVSNEASDAGAAAPSGEAPEASAQGIPGQATPDDGNEGVESDAVAQRIDPEGASES